jgi:ABC-2 type transport system permease protein
MGPMLSLPLLRTTAKSNALIWLIFTAVMVMYLSIIVSMFDPNASDSMDALLASLPPQLLDLMYFKTVDTSLLGFVAGYFYGFLIFLFPFGYSIIMADRMIARFVDSGSMAFLLSTPNQRAKIALTQAVFLAGSQAALVVVLTLVGVVVSEALFPGHLDIAGFLRLNFGVALLYFALGGIGFLASCLFNESKNSLALGGGLLAAFLLIKMLSGVSDQLSGLKYLSLLTLFDPAEIIARAGSVLPSFAALAILGLVLFGGGIMIFSQKDLPL